MVPTISGWQIRVARVLLSWEPSTLAQKAKVPLSVVLRAENSPGEPLVTIVQLNSLLTVLRAAGATFAPVSQQQDRP